MRANHEQQAGFTLIELMIVVVIAAILAAVALPTYQEQMRKGRRSDGEALLLDISGRLERYFYANGTYTVTLTAVGYGSNTPGSPESHYQGSVITPSVGCPIATCYILQVAPQGEQDTDGIMQLYSNGQKRRDKNEDDDTTDAGEDSWH